MQATRHRAQGSLAWAVLVLVISLTETGHGKPKKTVALPLLPLAVHMVVPNSDTGPSNKEGKAKTSSSRGQDPSWMRRQLREANRLMRPHGLRFLVGWGQTLKHKQARLDTPSDRDALARHLKRGMINVFVVQRLKDIDRKDRFISGVHWRLRRQLNRRYIILSEKASATTLAHELGHYFGNRHSPIDNNIMSYKRSNPNSVRFNKKQGRTLRRHAWLALRKKELYAIKKRSPNNATR
jgi:hypothetical protein